MKYVSLALLLLKSGSCWRKAIIFLLSTTLFLLVSTETFLRVVDPWGALRYFDDLRQMYAAFIEVPRGYAMAPGAYQFSIWSVTILPDTTRAVPDTNINADCTIALLGDSVTFAHGVSDADTWANVLAKALPDAHIINTGVNGHNIENVLRTSQTIKADGYIYLLINNDDDDILPWRDLQKPRPAQPAILQYLYVANTARAFPAAPYAKFQRHFEELRANPRVVTVAFPRADLSARVVKDYDVRVIADYTSWNSHADGHPDKRGNAQIAAAMLPVVREAMDRWCKP